MQCGDKPTSNFPLALQAIFIPFLSDLSACLSMSALPMSVRVTTWSAATRGNPLVPVHPSFEGLRRGVSAYSRDVCLPNHITSHWHFNVIVHETWSRLIKRAFCWAVFTCEPVRRTLCFGVELSLFAQTHHEASSLFTWSGETADGFGRFAVTMAGKLAIAIISCLLLLLAGAWHTALQAYISRVRFPMVSLKFFIHLILRAALWPWSRLNL